MKSDLSKFFPNGIGISSISAGIGRGAQKLHLARAFYRSRRSSDWALGVGIDSDPSQAGLKAMAEALERHSFFVRGRIARGNCSFLSLRKSGYPVLDPESYRFFSDRQAAVGAGELINPSRSTRLDWVWFEDPLADSRKILLPSAFGGRCTKTPRYFDPSSSGNGFGFSPTQAKLAAVTELIERDSVMFYWRTMNAPEAVDLEDLALGAVLPAFRKWIGKIRVYRLKTDLSVTAFLATYRGGSSAGDPRFLVASAAHLDPLKALQKALYELIHVLTYYRERRKAWQKSHYDPDFEASVWHFDDHLRFHADSGRADAIRFLRTGGSKPIRVSDLPGHSRGDPMLDLEHILEDFKAHGLRLYFRDIAGPEIRARGFCVYRAFSPDLISIEAMHRHRQLTSARYFTLPRKLGLRRKPASSEDLNRYPHPFS